MDIVCNFINLLRVTGVQTQNYSCWLETLNQLVYYWCALFAQPVPVSVRSKMLVCVPGLLGLRFRIPPWAGMSVCRECCVLSGRGLCDGLITRPEESYRLWCVELSAIVKRRQ